MSWPGWSRSWGFTDGSAGTCDRCTRDGVAHDEDGRILCEECLCEMTLPENYDDFCNDEGAFDYRDPDESGIRKGRLRPALRLRRLTPRHVVPRFTQSPSPWSITLRVLTVVTMLTALLVLAACQTARTVVVPRVEKRHIEILASLLECLPDPWRASAR